MKNNRLAYSIRFYKDALITAGIVLTTGHFAWGAVTPLHGASVSGAGNTLIIYQQDITTTVDNSHALYIENGGYAQVIDSTLTASGAAGDGFYATGQGSLLDISDSKISTLTTAGSAAVLRDGAHANLYHVEIFPEMRGIDSIGGTFTGDEVKIVTNGYDAVYSGKNASGSLTNSQINVSGAEGTAAFSDAGYLNLQNTNITLQSNNTALATANSGVIELKGGEITGTEGGTLFDIRHSGTVLAENFKATLSNDAGYANNRFINFDYTAPNTNLYFNRGEIDISGDNAVGIAAEKAFGIVNFDDTRLSLATGTAITVGNKSDFSVNLNHSEIASKTLLVNSYTDGNPDFIPQSFTLNANDRSVLEGNVFLTRAQRQNHQINLDNDSVLHGSIQGLQSLTLNRNSRWEITGDSSVDAVNISNSELRFDNNTAGFKMLTIVGDYVAENAKMLLNGALGGDNSPTDKVHIMGNSSGVTEVAVNNIGGSGAQTLEGITLIQVDGQAGGEFRQAGRIVAGAYDYALQHSSDRHRWMLTSQPQFRQDLPDDHQNDTPDNSETPSEPVQPAEPVNSDTPSVVSEDEAKTSAPVGDTGMEEHSPSPVSSVPAAPAAGSAEGGVKAMTVRPEAAGYLANAAAANTLFGAALNDRLARGDERLWLRSIAGRSQFKDSSNQIATKGHYSAFILGADLLENSFTGSDRLRVGAMAGMAQAQNVSRSSVTGYQARSNVNGYGFGVYANWQQRDADQNGAYVDSWLMYNTFKNSVSGEGLAQEHYRSRGFTGATEFGYRAKVATFNQDFALWLQPKASVSWHGVSAGTHKERNGTEVKDRSARGLQTSLGLRASLSASDNVNTALLPWVEVNWLQSSKAPAVSLDGANVTQAGVRNRIEVKAGINARLNKSVNLWAGVAYQQGSHGYRDTQGMLGLKIDF